jgi:hypothetical protein
MQISKRALEHEVVRRSPPNAPSPTAAGGVMPFAIGPNMVSPDSLAPMNVVVFNPASGARLPFPGRRTTVDSAPRLDSAPRQPPRRASNPLDLLSSVSAVAAPAPETEKYLGQRHPQTKLRHGKGVMKYSNGCRYVGLFHNDVRSGYGKCWYANGCVYAGQWKDGKRHGRGTMTYVNGDIYQGSWEQDQRHGAGVYHWKDGRSDVCQFYRQKIVGEGFRWSSDRLSGWVLKDGEMAMNDAVPSTYGRMISQRLGVQFP